MKKYFNLIFALFLMVFTACQEDADTPSTGDPINVAEEAAGTYSGIWNVTTGENRTEVGSFSGDITVSKYAPAPEERYACTLTISCDEYPALAGTAAANILKQSRAYKFYSEVSTNGLGSTFSGAIAFDGKCTMSYSKAVKEGRKTIMYYYEFVGAKN